ncbi:hypothetical protein Goari_016942, partial [Gossypium aridum]|nr:hypothetical protein [Gossypium aridum]
SYDNVLVQTNSLKPTKAIKEDFSDSSNYALIKRIHQILSQFRHWSICHIYRENNQDANSVVKLVQDRKYGLSLF